MVAVGVLVAMGVLVGVLGEDVAVAVLVAVAVGMGVDVLVATAVGVFVGIGVGVLVAVGVGVAVLLSGPATLTAADALMRPCCDPASALLFAVVKTRSRARILVL